jgi:hypothetical protein
MKAAHFAPRCIIVGVRRGGLAPAFACARWRHSAKSRNRRTGTLTALCALPHPCHTHLQSAERCGRGATTKARCSACRAPCFARPPSSLCRWAAQRPRSPSWAVWAHTGRACPPSVTSGCWQVRATGALTRVQHPLHPTLRRPTAPPLMTHTHAPAAPLPIAGRWSLRRGFARLCMLQAPGLGTPAMRCLPPSPPCPISPSALVADNGKLYTTYSALGVAVSLYIEVTAWTFAGAIADIHAGARALEVVNDKGA